MSGAQIYKEKTPLLPSAPKGEATEAFPMLPNSVMDSIARGTAAPTAEMLGRRETLAPALQAKMQGAFGADFSKLELYRSETARDAGFLGVASGNRVALSPDVDLSSHVGQSVLGHELSHVVAQSRGVGGSGFLGNSSLERQADVQGERAASGMRAIAGSGLSETSSLDFSAPTMTMGGPEAAGLTPLSATSGAFGMGAPMQGKKDSARAAPQEAALETGSFLGSPERETEAGVPSAAPGAAAFFARNQEFRKSTPQHALAHGTEAIINSLTRMEDEDFKTFLREQKTQDFDALLASLQMTAPGKLKKALATPAGQAAAASHDIGALMTMVNPDLGTEKEVSMMDKVADYSKGSQDYKQVVLDTLTGGGRDSITRQILQLAGKHSNGFVYLDEKDGKDSDFVPGRDLVRLRADKDLPTGVVNLAQGTAAMAEYQAVLGQLEQETDPARKLALLKRRSQLSRTVINAQLGMNLSSSTKQGGSTFFHETGHMADFVAGKAGTQEDGKATPFSAQGELGDAFYQAILKDLSENGEYLDELTGKSANPERMQQNVLRSYSRNAALSRGLPLRKIVSSASGAPALEESTLTDGARVQRMAETFENVMRPTAPEAAAEQGGGTALEKMRDEVRDADNLTDTRFAFANAGLQDLLRGAAERQGKQDYPALFSRGHNAGYFQSKAHLTSEAYAELTEAFGTGNEKYQRMYFNYMPNATRAYFDVRRGVLGALSDKGNQKKFKVNEPFSYAERVAMDRKRQRERAAQGGAP